MIFNKNGEGSEELYQISGTFQASTNFASISAEVDYAQREVASVVGGELMAVAEGIYAKETPTAAEAAFLLAVQRPAAYLAIAGYSKLTGLSHGDTGRKIKTDENEKIPFEWMIDRDDREMRERYFRALDSLFSFLDSADPASDWGAAWSESETKKTAASLVVKSIRDVETVYPLEHSGYMYHMLTPVIREIQNTKLRDIVGQDRLRLLIEGDESVSDIRSQALRFTVLLAIVTAVQRWSVEVFPLSVARRFYPSYQGNRESRHASTSEIDWFIGKINLQIKDAELELKTIIAGNPYEGMDPIPENSPRNKYFTV